MFLSDVFGILILVLVGTFLLFMPLAAAGLLVWTFGKVAKVKARIDAQRFVARQRGSKARPLGGRRLIEVSMGTYWIEKSATLAKPLPLDQILSPILLNLDRPLTAAAG